MKFAHFSHVWNKPGMTVADRYDQLWQELARCDEGGFDFAFAVEHHFSPQESWMPSPAVYAASASAHTKRLRLGPMGYVVPLYDPLRIVEEVAVLDNVLGGRLEVGLVSGIRPDYFRPYGADFENRRALTAESVQLLKTAFAADGSFSFKGTYHQYENVKLSVKPIQRPHPPMWIESRDTATLEMLAREGVHTGYLLFMPREEVAPRYREYLRLWNVAGHPTKPNVSYWTLVYVDETDALARERARPHLLHNFTKVMGYGDVGGVSTAQLAATFAGRGEHGAAAIAEHLTDPDYLMDNRLVFVGSPARVAADIRQAASDGFFNTMLCEFNFGSMPEEDLMRSIDLFANQVIPALKTFEPY
jgi:alkanesulfonate monooxygenase SsuD/methylene tetrahydromethanopterin reductase-like flavin-dependent oxidoreductase (luciferase family)